MINAKRHQVYLHLGSNVGNRMGNLLQARTLIAQQIGGVIKASQFYETQPWGVKNQPDFVNQALLIQTTLSPNQLLYACQHIEQEMGRTPARTWGERVIDIDILLYDQKVIQEAALTIPHPRMTERNFVLIPLMEIAPEVMHPTAKLSIEDLYDQCRDESEVVLLET